MKCPHARFLSLAAVLMLVGVALTVSPVGCSDGQDATAAGRTATTTALSSGSVVIEGLVDYPMTLTSLDLDYMDWFTGEVEHPRLGTIEYEGVRLSEVFWYVGVRSEAETVTITSLDGSTAEVALKDVSDTDAMMAVDETGALNMIMPGLEGDAWVTDVVVMEFK